MSEKNPEQTLVSVDSIRLRQFFVRLVAGLGLLSVWGLLLGAGAAAAIYAISWLFAQQGFLYAASFLFIPIGLFCWWVCYFLALEFVAEAGIELNGIARLTVVPVAIPIVGLSFIISMWVAVGEAINSKAVLAVFFMLGSFLIAAFLSLFF